MLLVTLGNHSGLRRICKEGAGKEFVFQAKWYEFSGDVLRECLICCLKIYAAIDGYVFRCVNIVENFFQSFFALKIADGRFSDGKMILAGEARLHIPGKLLRDAHIPDACVNKGLEPLWWFGPDEDDFPFFKERDQVL
ncbi:hypothetical protein A2973_05800 [Candidatus Gottesmanbacteria bacterium RIFCSPLOWO2_01_FULL_49_10]|uniref:Uncharacterized protein n=1 Tax=Candidatus Gottesmanbacteria bacterium RIFCSPLOWO2_01_FULL_49_10 TaxID=1798396 RepID=A0A1F6AVY3_9BACT|nr:MAG: hypothetical protein A2973_05800 [Candidatus Gottesmanbacteria bacterium RIFCSPLOWO2_01_FULL_49_10]